MIEGLKMRAKVRASAVLVDAEMWEGGPDLVNSIHGRVNIENGDWLVTVAYGAKMVVKREHFSALFEAAEGRVGLELNGYQAANLREALRSVMGDGCGALGALHTGDWCGELANALDEFEIHEEPNATSEEMREAARSWK